MYEQVVEITKEGTYLSIKSGSLVISIDSVEVGILPIKDIGTLLISNPACSISCVAVSRLLSNRTSIIFSGENYLPIGMALPINSTLTYGIRVEAQINLSRPLKKRIWQSVVVKKILNQAKVLDNFGYSPKKLISLSKKVLSGDTSNVEAQAARQYWQKLFGDDFRRDKRLGGINSLLNYGYTILRASVARAITSSGLNPSFSIYHSNKANPYALVDDLMEPYRPMIDFQVKLLQEVDIDYIFKESKRQLVECLTTDLKSSLGNTTTLSNALLETSQSYVKSIIDKENSISFASFIDR